MIPQNGELPATLCRDGNKYNWTTTMRWLWAVSNKQNACKHRATHSRQQSTYVDSLERSWQERGTIWGGGMTEKGQGGGDWVGITSSPLNQFQTYLPATPVQRKDQNLYCMCPGSEAALSAPWWSCLLMMKKRTARCQLVSWEGGTERRQSFLDDGHHDNCLAK